MNIKRIPVIFTVETTDTATDEETMNAMAQFWQCKFHYEVAFNPGCNDGFIVRATEIGLVIPDQRTQSRPFGDVSRPMEDTRKVEES